ncbi:MAG: M23 family metallopeptidase, partial [Bacteroidales bacterium]|nr:M23 family metallopeptidase [Bacteroidales bacterium]
DKFENSHLLIDSRMKLDMVSKKASIQSLSYDDVAAFSKRAEEMASCVPSIYPVVPSSKFRITSSYGYRSDPFKGVSKMHSGIDIGGPKGEPIFATGNGVVSRVAYNYYGYGNIVEIDHGFGYKTLYGHLTMATVAEGQTISKGDQIGTLGSTGRSTAPHLHYEVRYREKTVNPWNYFLNDMDEEEYKSIVRLSTPGARRR